MEIPGGSFEIGDQFDERGDNEKTGWFDELNPRGINIQPFQMGATEVTQTQWQAIMGSAPGHVLAIMGSNPSENSGVATFRWSR